MASHLKVIYLVYRLNALIFPIVQISSNGVITFGRPFADPGPLQVPPNAGTSFDEFFVIAPFSTDIDIRFQGSISYELHRRSTPGTDAVLNRINNFLDNRVRGYRAKWALVVEWRDVPPFPALPSEVYDPQLTMSTSIWCMHVVIRLI